MVLEGSFLAEELHVYSVLFLLRSFRGSAINRITARSIGAEAGR